jgi:hypothetical protein
MSGGVFTISIGALLAHVALGCQSPKRDLPETTRTAEVQRDTARPFRRIVSRDEKYAAIADEVPGFAGIYISGDTVVLMLVDTTRVAEARRALERSTMGFPQEYRHVVARRARYDFRQLREWKLAATNLMGREGGVTLGIDHRGSRVTVGVIDSAGVEPMRTALLARGIPSDAFFVWVSGRFVPLRPIGP